MLIPSERNKVFHCGWLLCLFLNRFSMNRVKFNTKLSIGCYYFWTVTIIRTRSHLIDDALTRNSDIFYRTPYNMISIYSYHPSDRSDTHTNDISSSCYNISENLVILESKRSS